MTDSRKRVTSQESRQPNARLVSGGGEPGPHTKINRREEKMDGQNEKRVTEFEDTNLVAYLHYKGFEFQPHNVGGTRIGFKVYGEIDEAVGEMYKNPEVKVMDFIKCLKSVRSAMFTLKGISNQTNA
jgi:hypothetical protein